MQKILRRRMLRDLRENMPRYLALGLMIILGMYIVISLVASADTVIIGTGRASKIQSVEDGQFTLFEPLSDQEMRRLTDAGITIEEHFYLDYETADGSILRVFADRKSIDKVCADTGRMPEQDGEILLEKRYSQEHGIAKGDAIQIGGTAFTVCGIGTSPDYEAPYWNLSDTAVDSSQFGTGFVGAADYSALKEASKKEALKKEAFKKEALKKEVLKKAGGSIRSEEYLYAYQLGSTVTDKELKEILKGFSVSADADGLDIDDIYFKEYWSRTGGRSDALKQGMQELTDRSGALAQGLVRLDEQGKSLAGAAGSFDDVPAFKNFKDGVVSYTGGVSNAAEGAGKLEDGIRRLSKETIRLLDDNFDNNIPKLTQFLPAEDNIRIGSAADDVLINKATGLLAGVLLMILFAYVLSVFVVHAIERESEVIGTLYALGVRRKELVLHYLFLPVMVALAAGMAGTMLGYSSFGVNMQLRETYSYFSIPYFHAVYAPYLIVYGVIMPPAAAAWINLLVIYKKLKQPVLALMRREHKPVREKTIIFRQLGFVRTFQIRQLLREWRTALTVSAGMLLALLVCMIGLDCYALCEHVRTDSAADTRYEYMYTYKYPDETVPAGGEEAFGMTLKKEILGYHFDVTLLGIHPGNPYFDAPVQKGQNHLLISSAVAGKFAQKAGDTFVLEDGQNDKSYAFTVDGIVPYSAGMLVFMDIGSMRELMGEKEDYYNIVFAARELDLDSGRLYAVSSKEEVVKSAAVFVEKMRPMIRMVAAASALLFIVVMYLMLKVMIDRSAVSISMMKIFGYRRKEIRKLYLNGNLAIVAVSAAVGIPLSKMLMDAAYPYLVSNVAVSLNLSFGWRTYAGLAASVLLLYFAVMPLLMRRINRIVPAEVLKSRE